MDETTFKNYLLGGSALIDEVCADQLKTEKEQYPKSEAVFAPSTSNYPLFSENAESSEDNSLSTDLQNYCSTKKQPSYKFMILQCMKKKTTETEFLKTI